MHNDESGLLFLRKLRAIVKEKDIKVFTLVIC